MWEDEEILEPMDGICYIIYIVPVCSRSRGMFPHFCGGYHMIRCGGFLFV